MWLNPTSLLLTPRDVRWTTDSKPCSQALRQDGLCNWGQSVLLQLELLGQTLERKKTDEKEWRHFLNSVILRIWKTTRWQWELCHRGNTCPSARWWRWGRCKGRVPRYSSRLSPRKGIRVHAKKGYNRMPGCALPGEWDAAPDYSWCSLRNDTHLGTEHIVLMHFFLLRLQNPAIKENLLFK